MKRFFQICAVLFITLAFANYSHASKPKKLTKTITWELKDDGTLIISGKGDMPDYGDWKQRNSYSKNCPWAKGKRRWAVKSVIIEEGITSIGDYAFCGNSITTLKIPNSVIFIGKSAFLGNNIKSLNIPDSVKSIGNMAFSHVYAVDWTGKIIHLPSWVTDKDCARMGISVDSYYEYGTPTVEWLLRKSEALSLITVERYDEALKYILRAINNEATTGPTAECYKQAGSCYFLLNSYNDAIKMYYEAYKLSSTDDFDKGNCAWWIGHIYRKYLNNNKEAYEWYTIASNLGDVSASEDLCKYYEETTASVNKIWAANTKDNTIFHLNNLSVNYAFKEKVTLILNIYDENKRQLTDKNNKYYSPDGYVQFKSEIASVKYLKSIWEDFTITVPTSEIHIDRTKKSRTPYCKLIVKDKDGKIVYTSPYFQFTLDKIETAAPAPTTTSVKKSSTTETAKTQTQTQTQTQTKTQTQTQQAYTPEYGYRDMWVTCTSCAGTGICPSCHGVGHVHGTYVQVCGFCGGTKACPFCGGRGGHYEKVQYQIR